MIAFTVPALPVAQPRQRHRVASIGGRMVAQNYTPTKSPANEFKATVNIWMGADGRVQRTELAGSTGNSQTDEQIRVVLAEMPPLREAPPSDMPQPIRLRVTSRF